MKDAAVLARLDPAARDKVLCTDLKAQGIKDYPPMTSANGWTSSDAGLEVFCADEPMTLCRWPNTGYAYIVDVKGPTPVDCRGTKGTAEGIFTYDGDRAKRWAGEPDLMANGFWMWDWANQRYRVKNIDLETLAMVASASSAVTARLLPPLAIWWKTATSTNSDAGTSSINPPSVSQAWVTERPTTCSTTRRTWPSL